MFAEIPDGYITKQIPEYFSEVHVDDAFDVARDIRYLEPFAFASSVRVLADQGQNRDADEWLYLVFFILCDA